MPTDKDARRLRILKLASWIGCAFTVILGISAFNNGSPTPKYHAMAALGYAVIPLLGRYSLLWAVAAMSVCAYAHTFMGTAIVSNAVRYTEQGGVAVGCRFRGTTLRIDVCDTGPGIPEDQRRSIFGEYYRLARPDAGPREGLGLGLAIVDRLCRLLGHRVEVHSRVGRGSRFSVMLPAAAEPPVATETVPPASLADDPARGKRIIVIDDDALVLDGMRGILQGWGCQVDTALSGDAAVAHLAEGGARPDLIISDSRLADGESGIDAIARLRTAAGAHIPALVITGDTAPERLREASAAGFPLLHKPVSPMALRSTLNRLLKAHDARLPAG